MRRTTLRSASLAGLALCFLWMGCRPGPGDDTQLNVEWTLQPDPPVAGPTTFAFTLADAGGDPITGATVEVEGNMSHPGMVPVFATAQEMEPGSYEARFDFTMGGEWFLTVDAELADGGHVRQQVTVPHVKAQ
jgi:hypothetical protein